MVIFLSALPGPTRPPTLQALYDSLGELNERTDGPYYLDAVDGTLDWPERGIYIFFSPDTDLACDPVSEAEIVRIGTVGAQANSTNSLWRRLRIHRGSFSGKYAGGGYHRSSIFRHHVGRSIIERDGLEDEYPEWNTPHSTLRNENRTTEVRAQEHPLEKQVTDYICSLPFLVVDIPGEPGRDSDRSRLETNLIALLSHARRTTPGLKSDTFLGNHSPRAEINKTGLWNIDHVNAFYTDSVVSELESYIEETDPVGITDD